MNDTNKTNGDKNPEAANPPQFAIADLFWLVTIASIAFGLFFFVYPLGRLFAWFTVTAYAFSIATKYKARKLQVACLLLISLGFFSIPYFMLDDHCVSPHLLDRIQLGSSMTTVNSVLGNPTKMKDVGSNTQWKYSGPTWCMVTISFDPSRNVNGIEHDH